MDELPRSLLIELNRLDSRLITLRSIGVTLVGTFAAAAALGMAAVLLRAGAFRAADFGPAFEFGRFNRIRPLER
jgi:hypothetical protein